MDFFSPTPVAHGDIAVVTAQEDLASLGEDVPLGSNRALTVALAPQEQMVLISVMESASSMSR